MADPVVLASSREILLTEPVKFCYKTSAGQPLALASLVGKRAVILIFARAWQPEISFTPTVQTS